MGKIGDVYYVVSLDANGIPQLAKKEGEKAGESFGKGMTGRLKKSLAGSKGQLLGAFGLGAGLGAATLGIAKLTEVIGDSIDAASDQREAMALTDQVFEDSAGTIANWSDTAADSFGESKTAAMGFASGFGNALKAAGLPMDDLAKRAIELTERAADLGSAFNASGEEVATAIKSGLVGESEPLRRFGVLLSDAAVRAEAVASGIAGAGEELTEGQKILARYNLILKQSSDSAGMFGRDSESLADAQKSLDASLEDISAELGQELVPILAELARTLKEDVIPAGRDLATLLGDIAGSDQGQAVIEMFEDLVFAMSPAHDAFEDQLNAAKAWEKATTKSTEKVADAVQSRSGEMRGDLMQVGDGFHDLGDDAKDAAKTVGISAEKMRKSSRELRDAWLADALAIVADYFDPIEARAEQLALKREIAAQKEIIASKNSTEAQIADAERRLVEISRANLELFLELAASGKVSRKEINTTLTAWAAKWRSATGQAREDLRRIVRQLVLVKIAAMQASGELNFGGLAGGGRGRAEGGPVTAGRAYVVGEKRPELFVPDVNGTILPSVPSLSGSSSSGGGGGNNYNVTLLDRMPVSNVRDIGSGLRMLDDQGYLPGSRK